VKTSFQVFDFLSFFVKILLLYWLRSVQDSLINRLINLSFVECFDFRCYCFCYSLCEHTSDEAQTCSDTVLNLAAADIHTNVHTDQTDYQCW